MLSITSSSHLDHGLSAAHIAFMLKHFQDRDSFFIETVELPEELSPLQSGLYGPAAGDAPIQDAEVRLGARGDRSYSSRLIDQPTRPTRLLTVIAGAHEGLPCMLYTAFGGPQAAREPGDPSLEGEELQESERFWAQHALSSMEVRYG